MRATLGDALWADIVAHANACKEDAFSSAFPKPVLRCVGPPHGGACPHNFRVDLTSARAYATLGELHLDHEQDLVVTCDMWVQALAAPLRARARHVDGMLLCHLLDSVLQVQENRSLENLLGFLCVFQKLRAAAVGLFPITWISPFRSAHLAPWAWRSASSRATEWFRSLILPSTSTKFQIPFRTSNAST